MSFEKFNNEDLMTAYNIAVIRSLESSTNVRNLGPSDERVKKQNLNNSILEQLSDEILSRMAGRP